MKLVNVSNGAEETVQIAFERPRKSGSVSVFSLAASMKSSRDNNNPGNQVSGEIGDLVVKTSGIHRFADPLDVKSNV